MIPAGLHETQQRHASGARRQMWRGGEGVPYAGRGPLFLMDARNLYPDGVDFTPQGFPNLRSYVKVETKVRDLTGNRRKDERKANKAVGLDSTPKGYT